MLSKVSRDNKKQLRRNGGTKERSRAVTGFAAGFVVLLVATAFAPLGGALIDSRAEAQTDSPYSPPGATTRVSVAENGTEPDDDSHWPDISADGRIVAFMSYATTLVPQTTERGAQVYVHDHTTGETELISATEDQIPGNKSSTRPSVSADGRFVAFHSSATNLVPGPLRGDGFHVGAQHVYVLDRETREMERVSVSTQGEIGDRQSWEPSISGDGRFVAFMSMATNLVPGDTNGERDIFVHDRATGMTERVSVASDGAQSNGGSWVSDITPDGRYVAFDSTANNLVADKTGQQSDVFVHDRETGTTERVSVTSDGSEGNHLSVDPSVSDDGRFVAFSSQANNFVPGDTNRRTMLEVFVHDRETGTTERVSVSSNGEEADGESRFPSISADGQFVSFESFATNITPGINNDCGSSGGGPIGETVSSIQDEIADDWDTCGDVFVHNRETGATERVSLGTQGQEGESNSWYHAMSADARYVVFSSDAHNLVESRTSDSRDMYLRDRGPTVGAGELGAEKTRNTIAAQGWVRFSGTRILDVEPIDEPGRSEADGLGGNITRVSLTHRIEQHDLLLRLGLDALPAPTSTPDTPLTRTTLTDPLGAGLPGVRYTFTFQLDERVYEARAARQVTDPTLVDFALYDCTGMCQRLQDLAGGMGTTGEEIRIGIPLQALDAEAGSKITNGTARSESRIAIDGPPRILHHIELEGTTIPAHGVRLGIAPPSAGEEDVAFNHEADLQAGQFAEHLDAGGGNTVWARVCHGGICGVASTGIE